MSGPITPPLTVTEVDGSPSGRPITTIKVSNGDLTISGNVATIDTTGSGGTPATPANSVQFNSDPAGTFTGSDRLLFETDTNLGQLQMKTGASITQAEIRAVEGWGLQLNATTTVGGLLNTISLQGENDGSDGIILKADNTGGTGENVVIYNGKITTSASGTSSGALTITSTNSATLSLETSDDSTVKLYGGTNANIDLTPNGTGQNRLISETVVVGNGTAHAFISSNDAYDLVLETKEGSDSPTIRLVHGTNGGITLTPAGTGAVSIGGNYTLPTDAGTDTYVMTSDGAGASSWAEAGGSGGFIPATPDGVTGPRFLLAPIGTMGATDGQEPSVGYLYACPFIGPKGGLSLTTDTSGGCSIRVVTGAASSSIIIGVYDADSGNNPQTLLATSTFDVASSGQQTNSWSDAVTLTAGELYYVAWLRPSDESGTVEIRSWESSEVPTLGWRNAISLYNMVYDIENSPMTSMPATFGTPDGTNGDLPSVGVVI